MYPNGYCFRVEPDQRLIDGRSVSSRYLQWMLTVVQSCSNRPPARAYFWREDYHPLKFITDMAQEFLSLRRSSLSDGSRAVRLAESLEKSASFPGSKTEGSFCSGYNHRPWGQPIRSAGSAGSERFLVEYVEEHGKCDSPRLFWRCCV